MIVRENVPPPQQVLNGLGRWLEAALGWKPANEGNVLARPCQTDTVSCAICALNTITHNVFGDQLWQQNNASVHRISWLLEFNKYDRLHPSVKSVGGFEFLSAMVNVVTLT